MDVENENKLLLLLSQEVLECKCLRFGEGLRPSKVVDTWVYLLVLLLCVVEPGV